MAKWPRKKLFFSCWKELQSALSVFRTFPKTNEEPRRGRPYEDPASVVQWATDRHIGEKSWPEIAKEQFNPADREYANGRTELEVFIGRIKRAVGRLDEVEKKCGVPGGTMAELYRASESKWSPVVRQRVAGALHDTELREAIGTGPAPAYAWGIKDDYIDYMSLFGSGSDALGAAGSAGPGR